MENTNVVDIIINEMHKAELFKIDGKTKKQVVLKAIKKLIDDQETYERYLPLVEMLIDSIVKISRKDIKLAFNHTKRLFSKITFPCNS